MASTYKDTYNAFDFAYGVNPAAGGALQVIAGSTGTGAYTLTCSPQYPTSADGKNIPLGIYTPITIGSDSGIETVTPTAVSLNQLNQILITATFTYAHATGAQVRSGSGGLQEAAAYAGANGNGGVISLTPQWFAAVGIALTGKAALLTYLVTGATLKTINVNTSIVDYSGATGSGVGTTAATSYLAATVGAAYTQGVRIY